MGILSAIWAGLSALFKSIGWLETKSSENDGMKLQQADDLRAASSVQAKMQQADADAPKSIDEVEAKLDKGSF